MENYSDFNYSYGHTFETPLNAALCYLFLPIQKKKIVTFLVISAKKIVETVQVISAKRNFKTSRVISAFQTKAPFRWKGLKGCAKRGSVGGEASTYQ